MKRTFSIYCMAACTALLALSCTKQMEPLQESGTPDGQQACEGLTTLTFHADNGTRTTLGKDFSVSWNEGDQVKILWNGGSAVAPAVIENGRVTFTASVDETGPYYAVYPADIDCSYLKGATGTDSLRISIPSEQKGTFAGSAVIVGQTTRQAMDFGTFRSAVSMISFTIENPDIRKVEFDAADECGIIGEVTIPGAISDFRTQASLGAISVPVDGAGTYYLAINPGTTLGGLAFHIGTADKWLGTATSSTPATIERGRILIPSGSVDSRIGGGQGGDVFIAQTAKGSADGSSWDNAGDVTLLKKILGSTTGVSVWKADGNVIRVAEGSYDISDDGTKLSIGYTSDVKVHIVGGYPAAASGKDISGCDPSANQTVFTTSATDAEGRILYGNNCKGSLNFEGITFSGVSSTTRGAVGYFNAGSKGAATFKNCSFKDNTTTSYGIFCAESASTFTFEGCTFSGNSVTYGTLCNEKNGTFIVKDCLFENNTATSTSASTGGAAIHAKQVETSGTSGSTIVSGSTFRGNVASSGGAAMAAAGSLGFTLCTFEDNEARSSFGGAVTSLGASVLDVAGCTFSGNIARATGGGAMAFSGTSLARLSGSTFNANRTVNASGTLAGNGGALLQVSGNKSTLFMCGCTFNSNETATNGPDLFSSAATAACIYNCTSASPKNNSAANLGCIRCNCPLLIANCTMAVYGAAGATSGVVSFGTSGEKVNTMINNLFVCNTGSAIATGGASTKREVATWGHNVYTAAPNINFKDHGDASDLTGTTASDFWSAAPSPDVDGVIPWDGPSTLSSFTAATAAQVEAAIKAYNPTSAEDVSAGVGTAFFNWLTSLGAFDKDAAGTSRGTGAWWPGSYQSK